MKPTKILNAAGGIDVVTPETELSNDTVRTAENVVLHNDGGFDLRPGATKVLDLPGAHSLWQSESGVTMCVAGETLFRVTGSASSPQPSSIATVGPGRASYAEIDGNVYVSCGELLRIDADGAVWLPGVASLAGIQPVLSEVGGGLPAGTYGVAFSGVNSEGEESGLSDVAYIELATANGIHLELPATAGDAVRYRIYRTTVNGGDDLRLCDEIPRATSHDIAGGEAGRLARAPWRDRLPAGQYITAYRGRLYSAIGQFLFESDAMSPGLYDTRNGWIAMPSEITMVIAVDGGIFVGTRSRVYFLNGTSGKDFKLEIAAKNGAFPQQATLADATMFNAKMVDTARPVALWLSTIGYQVGLPGGAVASPQADKIRLDEIEGASTIAFTLGGVKQVVSAVETMTLGNGGATDTTP